MTNAVPTVATQWLVALADERAQRPEQSFRQEVRSVLREQAPEGPPAPVSLPIRRAYALPKTMKGAEFWLTTYPRALGPSFVVADTHPWSDLSDDLIGAFSDDCGCAVGSAELHWKRVMRRSDLPELVRLMAMISVPSNRLVLREMWTREQLEAKLSPRRLAQLETEKERDHE